MDIYRLIIALCGLILTVAFGYQMVYHVIGFLARPVTYDKGRTHTFAILVAARNEAHVISDLFESIRAQDYPQDKLKLFVVADNCDDDTAARCRAYGATVYERFNKEEVGKGYALDYLLTAMLAEGRNEGIDAYMIFDADNILAPDYIRRMNDCYASGETVVTSYRNAKNMDDNWQTMGYTYGFIHDARFLNNVRNILGNSSAISGTGYLLDAEIIDRFGGWPFHSLTEDTEATFWLILHGYRIAYCHDAIFYDEQPTRFRQAWDQRLRWTKGSFQAFTRYGGRLLKRSLIYSDPSAWDLMVLNSPIQIVTVIIVLINVLTTLAAWLHPQVAARPYVQATLAQLLGYYGMFVGLGFLTMLTEWKRMAAPVSTKILGIFGYGIHMVLYPFIYTASLFQQVTWRPITHQGAKGIETLHPDE